eukprot:GEZU01010640.1.p1 GENE.GEZU01010640.1~~GEZU01010640.1.p1  ORF type:complete len:120 (-),score=0.09 GEZU01010640.1:122-481(-)
MYVLTNNKALSQLIGTVMLWRVLSWAQLQSHYVSLSMVKLGKALMLFREQGIYILSLRNYIFQEIEAFILFNSDSKIFVLHGLPVVRLRPLEGLLSQVFNQQLLKEGTMGVGRWFMLHL